METRRREPERDEKRLSGHRHDGSVAVGGIGNNLRRWGTSAVSEVQTKCKYTNPRLDFLPPSLFSHLQHGSRRSGPLSVKGSVLSAQMARPRARRATSETRRQLSAPTPIHVFCGIHSTGRARYTTC